MSISTTLQKFLAQQGIGYDIVPHRHTGTSMNAAGTAHVPAAKVAKSVILEDENGYLMAVVPADHHVKIGKLNRFLGRKMGLATETELKALFSDCEPGAIPPVGQAFGIDTIVDDSLNDCQDIYMEAGDHEDFIHLNGVSFRKLMRNAQHARIC
ncbi:MAG: YbaK/EbsC family protein [Gammaproteobacteria bacterium]|nr:YbaK/EbsC family protein [Gammaproteobacteria bacterium]